MLWIDDHPLGTGFGLNLGLVAVNGMPSLNCLRHHTAHESFAQHFHLSTALRSLATLGSDGASDEYINPPRAADTTQSYLRPAHNALHTPPLRHLRCPASRCRSSSTFSFVGKCTFKFFDTLSFRDSSPIKAIEDRSLAARAPVIKFHLCKDINLRGDCFYLASEPLTVLGSNSGCVDFKAEVAASIASVRVIDTWQYSVSLYE